MVEMEEDMWERGGKGKRGAGVSNVCYSPRMFRD